MASKEAIDAALQVPSSDNRSLQYVICRGLPPMKFGASEQEADRLVGVALAAAATIDGDYNAGIEAAATYAEMACVALDIEHWMSTKKELTRTFAIAIAAEIRKLKRPE